MNKKNHVIVIDNDSSNSDVTDGYDTDDTEEGMPKMQKPEYDSSNDEDDEDDDDDDDDDNDDDVSPEGDEIKAEAEAPPSSTIRSRPKNQKDANQVRTWFIRVHKCEYP